MRPTYAELAQRLDFAEAAKKALAAALHAPDSATWPELVAMAEANVDQCSTNVHGSGERCIYGAYHPRECDT